MFEVETEAQARQLAWYETDRYEAVRIRLTYEDGEGGEEEGWVFRWCGEQEDLEEGIWDLGLFLIRMGWVAWSD